MSWVGLACFLLSCAAVWFVTVNRTPTLRREARR